MVIIALPKFLSMDLIKIDEITIWRKRQKYGWGTRSEVRNELIVLCKVVRFFSSPTDMCLLTEDLRQARLVFLTYPSYQHSVGREPSSAQVHEDFGSSCFF